jgi:uncharacterized membrane protein HdeD (DUF308 family)
MAESLLELASRRMKTAAMVSIAAGVIAIFFPLFAAVAVAVFVGAILMLFGAFWWWVGLSIPKGSKGRGWTLFEGIFCSFAGTLMIVNPAFGVGTLSWILAVVLLGVGTMRLISAFEVRPLPGWALLLTSGLLSILMGFLMLAQWPVSGAWGLGSLVGISFLVHGFARLSLYRVLHRAATA